MFAHYSKSDMAFVSITTIQRRFKKIRRLRHGFYKHAYHTLDSTHWFRKLFYKIFLIVRKTFYFIYS
nr:MAG TPA: hypothetical protein [Caudoviricetes sp.]